MYPCVEKVWVWFRWCFQIMSRNAWRVFGILFNTTRVLAFGSHLKSENDSSVEPHYGLAVLLVFSVAYFRLICISWFLSLAEIALFRMNFENPAVLPLSSLSTSFSLHNICLSLLYFALSIGLRDWVCVCACLRSYFSMCVLVFMVADDFVQCVVTTCNRFKLFVCINCLLFNVAV